MVQKKEPHVLVSKIESNKNHTKTEKHVFSHQKEDIDNKRVAHLKRKMKKARSIKRISELENFEADLGTQYLQLKKPSTRTKLSLVRASEGSSPNYMKPTTSSDARNERLQVSLPLHTTGDTNRRPTNSNNMNSSKVSSSSATASFSSNNKPAKVLTRRSSLKHLRPSMKKTLAIPLFPKINVSRATCSSTLKDSKFAKELELSPGATESEGTSAVKVCPYSYCSLNGHRHEPLPPLKSFLSARRRLLKTQKSMKLKGMNSFRKRGLRKDEKHNRTGQDELMKVDDHFFIKIYAKLCEELAFDEIYSHATTDEEIDFNPGIFSEVSSICHSEKGAERKIVKSPVDECSNMSYEDNLETDSDISVSELEDATIVLSDVESHGQTEAQVVDLHQDYSDRDSDHSAVNYSSKNREIVDNDTMNSNLDGTTLKCDVEMTRYPDEGSGDVGTGECFIREKAQEGHKDIDHDDEHFRNNTSYSEADGPDGDKSTTETTLGDKLQETFKEIIHNQGTQEMDLLQGFFSYRKSECSTENGFGKIREIADPEAKSSNPNAPEINCDEKMPIHPDGCSGDDRNGESLLEEAHIVQKVHKEFGREEEHFCNATSVNEKASPDGNEDTREIVLEEKPQRDSNENIHEDEQSSSDASLSGDNQSDRTVENIGGGREIVLGEKFEEGFEGKCCDAEHFTNVSSATASEAARPYPTDNNHLKEDCIDTILNSCYDDVMDQNSESPEVCEHEDNDNLNNETHFSFIFESFKEDIAEDIIEERKPKSEITLEFDIKATYGIESEHIDQNSKCTEIDASEDKDTRVKDGSLLLHCYIEKTNESAEVEGTTNLPCPEIDVLENDLVETLRGVAEGVDMNTEPENRNQMCDAVDAGHEHNCSDNLPDAGNFAGNKEKFEKNQSCECNTLANSLNRLSTECDDGMYHEMQHREYIKPEEEKECVPTNSNWAERVVCSGVATTSNQLSETDSELKSRIRITRKKADEEMEDMKAFNPRAPNFLPVEPDPGAETVDLRHQISDERKSAEEWMIDYALQQVVNKLGPARKKKVALLVEAFETVTPLPIYEEPRGHSTPAFAHVRPLQACG